MPFIKRVVEPSSLCHQALPSNISNELECVTNNALSNVILQLSSLSLHAEDVFGELFSEASTFYSRANNLQDRIDQLSQKVTQLDSSIEEVSLHDINNRKAFKSSLQTNQQVMSRDTMLQVIRNMYDKAAKPPPLHILNRFRDDGRDALKIYTDPDYFFNLWREAMQKEMRTAREKRRGHRRRDKKGVLTYREGQTVKVAVSTQRQRAKERELGEEFVGMASYNMSQSGGSRSKKGSHKSPSNRTQSAYNRDNTDFSPVMPRSNDPPQDINYALAEELTSLTPVQYEPPPQYVDLPEPPPPPPVNFKEVAPASHFPTNLEVSSTLEDDSLPISLSPKSLSSSPPSYIATPTPPPIDLPPPPPIPGAEMLPPPPPPPPPEPVEASLDEPSSPPDYQSDIARQFATVRLNPVAERQSPAPAVDSRSELLQAIRLGHELRKVEKPVKETKPFTGDDVAAILARRIALILTDSESGSYSSDDDMDMWGA